ncbi:MAG TPA: hypothetical protein VIL33_01470 [Rhodothermia bacterium]
MTITEDLDTYLADFGVTVVVGAVSGSGNFSAPDQIINGVSISTEYSVLVKYATFSAVAVFGASIAVDGTNYTIREVTREDDGAFARISLTKV